MAVVVLGHGVVDFLQVNDERRDLALAEVRVTFLLLLFPLRPALVLEMERGYTCDCWVI